MGSKKQEKPGKIHTISANHPLHKNGGDNLEVQKQFQQLQQQVQDLLNRNSSDERMLSESQLTQVKSLVQATVNETIEQTAAAAAQAALNAFTGSLPCSQAVGELKIRRRRRQRERHKNNRFNNQKTTILRVHHAFLYISLPSLHDYDVKMPNFTLYRESTQATTRFPLSFCTWLWY